MKGILVILDGLGDLPSKQLDDKTPLEGAEMPNLDFLAARSSMGIMDPVKPGFVPESDEAIVSIFGNDQLASTRGQLEVRGAGLKVTRGDLALRANFGTIDNYKDGNVLDRRAGRTLTTIEAEKLGQAINKMDFPVKFAFKPTVQHRAALVFRGGFSDNIMCNDITYYQGKSKSSDKIVMAKPLDEDENALYTSNMLNEFIEKSYEVLDKHPVNEERRKKGLLPANYLFVRGAGIEIPKLRLYKKWMSVASMPLERGFSSLSGMNVYSFNYPKLKSLDSYENLYDGLERYCKNAIKFLKKNYKKYEYAYIHVKETDLPGHDNKPLEKRSMLEHIDSTLFKFLRRFAPPNKIRVVVTGDHSTPCKLKNHSSDPVPVLVYDNSIPEEKHFCESVAKKGKLGRFIGNDLFKKTGLNK